MKKEVFFKIPLTPGFLLTCCKEGNKCMRLIQPSSCCQETSKSRKARSTTPAVQLQALQVTDAWPPVTTSFLARFDEIQNLNQLKTNNFLSFITKAKTEFQLLTGNRLLCCQHCRDTDVSLSVSLIVFCCCFQVGKSMLKIGRHLHILLTNLTRWLKSQDDTFVSWCASMSSTHFVQQLLL